MGLLVALGGCAVPIDDPEVGASEQALTPGSGCYNTARGSALRLRDEDSRELALPFAVDFYGNAYTSLWVNSNGNVTLNGANPSGASTTVPAGALAIMAPLYGDLNPGANISSDVFFNTVGTAPDRQVLITWYIVPESGGTDANTFQLQLHESDGAIIFTYDALSTDGINPDASPMNIGIASGAGQHTLVASGGSIPAYAGTATRFDWNGSDYGVVDGCDPPPPPPSNAPPTADAGADQVLECTGGGSAVASLDGSGSSDPDGDPLSFDWSDDAGSIASGATADVSLAVGSHDITLTVDDGELSDSDTVSITVEDTSGPSIEATQVATELWPSGRMKTVLTGVSASDLCCDATVSVSVSGDPEDHEVVDNGDGTFDVRVRAEKSWDDHDGRVYTIAMAAVDCAGNSTVETVTVTVDYSDDNFSEWCRDFFSRIRDHFGDFDFGGDFHMPSLF